MQTARGGRCSGRRWYAICNGPAPRRRDSRSTLLIEALNPRDVPNYLFSTQAEAHAIRVAVGAPNLRVQMDFYHAQIVEGDLATTLERWLPHIGHIQIAGAPGRHEPDVGEINYAWLLRRVDELGYDGWVGCEYRPLRDTVSGMAWRERLLSPGPDTPRSDPGRST